MIKPRKLKTDPTAKSAVDNLPAFISRPGGAPVYHGFPIIPETMTNGWVYGAITDYESEEGCTEGDGFVVAPDGSRAGIAWAIDTQEFYEILPPCKDRWGVYGICFPKPVSCIEDLVDNFRAILPVLMARYHDISGQSA